MEKKQQQSSLLSDSLSEPDVPDLELVPPIKNKKRRRIKLPSSKPADPATVWFSVGNSIGKLKASCINFLIALTIASLVIGNIYLTYLMMETRSQLELMGRNVARIHAESTEYCDAKISAAQAKAVETAVVKAYELMNTTMANLQREHNDASALMSQMKANVSNVQHILDTLEKEHQQTLTTFFSNITELRELCASCTPTAALTTEPNRVGGRP